MSRYTEKMLDNLQKEAFGFFLQEYNPDKGLVRDKSDGQSPASIAAIGFGLASYIAVSYTHLDVYKRQASTCRPPSSRPPKKQPKPSKEPPCHKAINPVTLTNKSVRPDTSKPVTRKKVSARKPPKPALGPRSTNSPAAAKKAAPVGARINLKLCQPYIPKKSSLSLIHIYCSA